MLKGKSHDSFYIERQIQINSKEITLLIVGKVKMMEVLRFSEH
ncbi:MAG: hypothetical protein ACLPN1_10920 [Dissulfurispiraceae bacterium]